MQKITITLPEKKLVGISVRTSTADEMNPNTAKIGATLQRYFQEKISEKITDKSPTSGMYCVYTEYESDFTGAYTYFVGEEVNSVGVLPEKLETMTLPGQTYVKFTTDAGAMPAVCIHAWQEIWKMTTDELGGKRSYGADFEVYDERAMNPNATVLDILIGIEEEC